VARSVEKQRRGGGLRKGVDLTRGAGLAVRERSGEEELTSGPRVAMREREEGGGSGPTTG
jgi:hypothetical protein